MDFGKIEKIVLDENSAYLAGVIVGDGNISNATKSKKDRSKDYRVTIELVDKEYLHLISNIVKSIIRTKSQVRTRFRPNKKREHHYFQFRNKSFYYFLTKDLEIPSGKKSSIVRIPTKIFTSLSLQKNFLAGLFDTDGGIRSSSIGFTTASINLVGDISEILNNLGIAYKKECWINKKYKKEYYGIRIKQKSIDRFLKNLPMKNLKKRSKVFHHVSVPEWSNGLDNSLMKIKN
jgi:intein/homing endonuclease